MYKQDFDVLIIGGGPSALREAISLEGTGLNTCIISDSFGGNMQIMGDIKLQSYIPELEIKGNTKMLLDYIADPVEVSPTGNEYTQYIKESIQSLNVKSIIGVVREIESVDGKYMVTIFSQGCAKIISCKYLVLATGTKPKTLKELQNIEHMTCFDVYKNIKKKSFNCFINKDVILIGSGNSAFQLGGALVRFAKRISLFTNTHTKFYPFETHNRFSLRAHSAKFNELIHKSMRNEHKSSNVFSKIESYSYKNIYQEPGKNSITFELNDNCVPLQASHCNQSSSASFITRSLGENSLFISAIGIEPNLPDVKINGKYHNYLSYLSCKKRDSIFDGLYVTGAAAGARSINDMENSILKDVIGKCPFRDTASSGETVSE